ncbi:MAG: hypothetical protein FWB76_06795 [Oscillospiraceae bacterium]|nr:hypothetical protein [Oscillospiraceae bacterium]
MQKLAHPLETLVKTLSYKGVDFELVERPDVIWVGCVKYANNNTDEPNMDGVMERYQKLCKEAPYREKVNPDYSACLSINFSTSEKPCGMMYACEFYPDQQHKGFDLLTQPGGLWLRVRNDEKAAALCSYDGTTPFNPWEYTHAYFAGEQSPLASAAKEHGYTQNPDVHMQIEYHCHAEYGTPPHTNYAYIPIKEIA